jgi:hypothetical protein
MVTLKEVLLIRTSCGDNNYDGNLNSSEVTLKVMIVAVLRPDCRAVIMIVTSEGTLPTNR